MPTRPLRIGVFAVTLLLTACENESGTPSASRPSNDAITFKEAVKVEAGKVADAAREGAANIAQSAKEVAHVAKTEALEIAAAARELARTTREQSVVVAQNKFDEARQQLAVLNEQRQRVQESLRPEYERAVAELSDRVAELDSRVRELREAAPDAWRQSVERLAPLVADVRGRVDAAWNAYVAGGRVQGSVTYLERMLLPENAELHVRLLDTSRSDANPETLAEQTVQLQGAPPFAFDLRFDPARTAAKGAYAVEAEIRVNGARRFVTSEPKRITLGDGAARVEVLVKSAE
jgi:uncharacterized lipoprotein YbaY